jgi:trimethylamine--corrinoid protein Co-methyltransferase
MVSKFKYEDDIYGYCILRNEDLEALHEATLDLMEDYGLQIHGEEALEIYSAAGCDVDRSIDRVRFPRNLVNDSIESCPAEFTLCGRDPKNDTLVGGKNVAFKNFGTGVLMIDPYTGEVRDSTKEDLGNVARFIDAMDTVDVFSIAVAAGDVNQKVKSLHEAEVVFNNLTKNFAHDLEGIKNTQRFIDMAAAIQGGYDKLRERPIITMGACPNSPLEINENETDIIMLSAKYGLPIDILSMGLCGGTTPATLAGTLVTTNAEILGGIVLSQILNKGNPILYGSSTTIMDMKSATSPVGAPEHAMCGAAVGQIGHYYGIPTNVGGT